MQLTLFDLLEESPPASSSGRTSPASSQPRTTPSGAFWQGLPAKVSRWNHQGESGRTLVVCLVPREQSRGGSLMPNISSWHNAGKGFSLSQVLETGSIPQRFFLSSTACAGILRRAEKRGKALPHALQQALQTVAQHTEREAEAPRTT